MDNRLCHGRTILSLQPSPREGSRVVVGNTVPSLVIDLLSISSPPDPHLPPSQPPTHNKCFLVVKDSGFNPDTRTQESR